MAPALLDLTVLKLVKRKLPLEKNDVFPQRYEGEIPRRKRYLSLIVRVRRLHRGGILGVEPQRIKSNH